MTVINSDPITGSISGTGTQPDFTMSGTLIGSQIAMHWIYQGGGYNADLVGTVQADQSMSGTFTDSQSQSGTWTASPASGLAWDLVSDFGANPSSNPGPDKYGDQGVWNFMQSASFAHDGNYSLLPHYANQFAGVSGFSAWYGDVSSCIALPVVGINTTLSTQHPCTPSIPAGTVFVHPANPQMVIVGWKSPISGAITITGEVADDDPTCGDGIRWYVDEGTTTIAAGAIPNGGSATFPMGLQATVQLGTFLYFIVDPGANGDISCDTSRLDVSIVQAAPYSNAHGTVVTGQPNVSGSWALGTFDYEHVVTGTEPQACFVSPGCNIDSLGAMIEWGDLSVTARGSVMCVLAPYPFPPPPAEVEQCGITGIHTYASNGTYLVTLTLSPSGPTIQSEALIFAPANNGQIRSSVGELIAFDKPYNPNDSTTRYQECSATVVHSLKKNLIITAAHCVGQLGGPLYKFLRFAPKFDGTICPDLGLVEADGVTPCPASTPLGVWSATSADVTVDPNLFIGNLLNGSQRFDFALVTVHPYRSTNSNVEDAAAGISIEINPGANQSWTSYGYPIKQSVPNFSQGTLKVYFDKCTGTSTTDPVAIPGSGPPGLAIPCDFHIPSGGKAEGASGGPWIDNNQAIGAVNKAYVDGTLVGVYLSNEFEQDYLNVSLAH